VVLEQVLQLQELSAEMWAKVWVTLVMMKSTHVNKNAARGSPRSNQTEQPKKKQIEQSLSLIRITESN